MPNLFEPANIGPMEVRNRFVHSATWEHMASDRGEVTDKLVKRYSILAKGEVGLIIPGHMYVLPRGQAQHGQTGIHSDDMIPGLTNLATAVHDQGGAIIFQLNHGGRQAPREVMGRPPQAPSSFGRDPISLNKPKAASAKEIQEVVAAFGQAAACAQQAGADGVQLHCAHGYLLNEFLSPFFNRRSDDYGGSDENRFRMVKEVILAIKEQAGDDYPILVKLNTTDYTPKPGVVRELAAKYAAWLRDLGVCGVELSGGTYHSYGFRMCRGDIPVKELKQALAWWMRPLASLALQQYKKACTFKDLYHLEAAKIIKPVINDMKLLLVGGVRSVEDMERVFDEGLADFFSMSRPFIRQPDLVKRMREGKTDKASCISCNMCLAGVFNGHPVACYTKGIPGA